MKINLYKLVIFIGIFSINYNFGMESLNLNNSIKIDSDSMERETFDFYISFLGDMIYKINIRNEFEKVEVEKIENIFFHKVPLDKKNEEFVYIPKFREGLNINKFSNKQIFKIYKGFTFLANDNKILKINEENRSEIFKYLLLSNIYSLSKYINLNKDIEINFRANNSRSIYIKDIAATIRNSIVPLNSDYLINMRDYIEREIPIYRNELKKINTESLSEERVCLNTMKNNGMNNTEEYKERLEKYKNAVNIYNKLDEKLKYFKEELEYNNKIIKIEGKDDLYKELKEKNKITYISINSEQGQKDLKNKDEKIKLEIIENINNEIKEKLAIEYNEGKAEIDDQSDDLLQQMINDERNKELIKNGDKLAIFKI